MRKWVIEGEEEVEAVLDTIWSLHDKLSHIILSISTTHLRNKHQHQNDNENAKTRFGLYKDYEKDKEKDGFIAETKGLTSIRSALHHLQHQLHFFHTVQIQQRSEREAALAQLEQSRLNLELRLAEHSGKRYTVIDEAMEFVGDVRDASYFIKPEHLTNLNTQATAPAEHPVVQKRHGSNLLVRFLFSGVHSVKQILQLDKMGGMLGNATLFAFSMLALLHLQQVSCRNNDILDIDLQQDKSGGKLSRNDGYSSTRQINRCDVWSARG